MKKKNTIKGILLIFTITLFVNISIPPKKVQAFTLVGEGLTIAFLIKLALGIGATYMTVKNAQDFGKQIYEGLPQVVKDELRVGLSQAIEGTMSRAYAIPQDIYDRVSNFVKGKITVGNNFPVYNSSLVKQPPSVPTDTWIQYTYYYVDNFGYHYWIWSSQPFVKSTKSGVDYHIPLTAQYKYRRFTSSWGNETSNTGTHFEIFTNKYTFYIANDATVNPPYIYGQDVLTNENYRYKNNVTNKQEMNVPNILPADGQTITGLDIDNWIGEKMLNKTYNDLANEVIDTSIPTGDTSNPNTGSTDMTTTNNWLSTISTTLGNIGTGITEQWNKLWEKTQEMLGRVTDLNGSLVGGRTGTSIWDKINELLGRVDSIPNEIDVGAEARATGLRGVVEAIQGLLSDIKTNVGSIALDIRDKFTGEEEEKEEVNQRSIPNILNLTVMILIALITLFLASLRMIIYIGAVPAMSTMYNENMLAGINFLKTNIIPGFGLSFFDIVTVSIFIIQIFALIKLLRKYIHKEF